MQWVKPISTSFFVVGATASGSPNFLVTNRKDVFPAVPPVPHQVRPSPTILYLLFDLDYEALPARYQVSIRLNRG